MSKYTSIEQAENVTTVLYDVNNKWSHTLLLISDVHHDSVYCNRELELEHLKEAARRRADICYFGDYFDAMQGRFDPRRSMDELRPEYRREDYYDFVVEDTAEFLAPYARQIRLMAPGNHETKVRKHANIDLLNRLAVLLNLKHKTNILIGGYGGWIRLLFRWSGENWSGTRTSVRIKYFHGAGGDAPVTRGVIWTNRQAVYLPDADVVVNGHNHHGYYVPISRERINNKGGLYFDIQHHLRIPGYKCEYADGRGGWMVERGGVPKPIGAWWLHLRCKDKWVEIIPEPAITGPVIVGHGEDGGGDYGQQYPEDSEYP